MAEPLPDHYKALGLDKKADAAAIKSVYRKLVLKCHPDKVTDPELKQQKQEEFHRIQQAYEVLSDEQKRADYEANLTLEALRKEKAARTSSEKTARFDVRTTGGASFMATGPSRYATEERKPARGYDDDDRYYDERSRSKYDTYPAFPKNGSPRSGQKDSPKRPTADRTRSERTKTRDRESRNSHKFVAVDSDSSSDDRARFDARRRSADVDRKQRKQEDRRSYDDTRYPSSHQRKMSAQEEEAIRYQHKSRASVEAEIRPSLPRTTSTRDYPGDSRPRKESRPEPVRRSSARPKDRSAGRIVPEIVDWSEHRMPSFKHSSSSPANIEIPRAVPLRSQTESARDYRSSDASPPSFGRSTTMPSVPRRKDSGTGRSSGLRESMTSDKEDGFPFAQPPPASTTTKYYYPTPGTGGQLHPEDVLGSGHRTVLREPDRRRRSPSPLGRPPMGANLNSEQSVPQYKPKAPAPPPLSRSSTARVDDRSSRPLFGEMPASDARSRRQGSYNPNNVRYSPKIGPEDIRWAPRGRENERDYPSKPALGRTATFAY